MLYVAVRGSQADGHRFVADAVRRGATAVMVESAQYSMRNFSASLMGE
ncbi:MAG TPA: Mur ligase domain-containing protein [Agromyces sp.]|nr:Mur ligase domain-containing protein [Agromyces sp.]